MIYCVGPLKGTGRSRRAGKYLAIPSVQVVYLITWPVYKRWASSAGSDA